MTKVKVTAPNSEYTAVGPAGVQFRDGVAEYDNEIPEHRAALAYFRENGYGVGGQEPQQPEPVIPEDSREVGGERQIGTNLRDAAVNPKLTDFLPPVNAGVEDPHGPKVASPGLHGHTPGPIVPGDVHTDDPRAQEGIESQVAEAVLVDGRDVGEVTQAAAELNNAGEAEPTDAAADEEPKRPAQNATKDEWADYARTVDAEHAQEIGSLTKAQLIERYGH